MQTTWEEIKII